MMTWALNGERMGTVYCLHCGYVYSRNMSPVECFIFVKYHTPTCTQQCKPTTNGEHINVK